MTVVPGGGHTWCTPSPEISLGMSAGVARRGYWNTRVSLTRSPQPRAPAVGSRRLGTHGHVEVRRVRVRAGVALGHPLIPARPETPSEDDVGRGEVVCGSDDDRPRLDPPGGDVLGVHIALVVGVVVAEPLPVRVVPDPSVRRPVAVWPPFVDLGSEGPQSRDQDGIGGRHPYTLSRHAVRMTRQHAPDLAQLTEVDAPITVHARGSGARGDEGASRQRS